MQKNKVTIIDHFHGELKPDTIRRVTNERMVHEMRNALKISPSLAWRIKLELPVDMATDCDKAKAWCNDRLMKFVSEGFLCFELEAFLEKVKMNKEQKEPEWVPYWYAMVVHPDHKDPRQVVERCGFFSGYVSND